MKPLAIEGMGIVCTRGRGLDKFVQALKEGWIEPSLSEEGRMAYRISQADLSDREVLKRARRADRFSRLTVLAAHDAMRDSALKPEDAQKTGVIVATAFGAHGTIFKFLDDIIDYGEKNVSPTTFAHSIHNAAASYIAGVLECKGPTMTITQFHFSFQQALVLAYAWLHEGRADRVLVGVAEECSPAMEYICEEKLSIAADGKMDPLSFSEKPKLVPGEGSVFYLLSLNQERKKYGAFADVVIGRRNPEWNDLGLSVVGAHGMAGSERGYANVLKKGKAVSAYSMIYGGMLTGGGFDCAAAALALKNQELYGAGVLSDTGFCKTENLKAGKEINAVQCVSHGCDGELAFIKIIK